MPYVSANLRDLRLLNRRFGGAAIALEHLGRLARPLGRPTLLDVGTGSGDIPLAACRRLGLEVTATDISPEVLAEARAFLEGAPIRLLRADARHLPFSDASFDLVTCCLALHHFSPEDATRSLAEMWRVARHAVLVVDLRRSYPSYVATWLVTHTAARSRLTRHDGPLSVLRSYTAAELDRMAADAGLRCVNVQNRFPSRVVLEARKDGHGT